MVAEEWQPIETAPRNGRTLWLGWVNPLGKWRTGRGQWFSTQEIAEVWEDPDEGGEGWYETASECDDLPNCWPIAPTHWMLPRAQPTTVTGEVKP